jgi:hypothetical protein
MTLMLAFGNPVNSTILRKCKKVFDCQTLLFNYLLRNQIVSEGPRHTRHFDAQYCDKKLFLSH